MLLCGWNTLCCSIQISKLPACCKETRQWMIHDDPTFEISLLHNLTEQRLNVHIGPQGHGGKMDATPSHWETSRGRNGIAGSFDPGWFWSTLVYLIVPKHSDTCWNTLENPGASTRTEAIVRTWQVNCRTAPRWLELNPHIEPLGTWKVSIISRLFVGVPTSCKKGLSNIIKGLPNQGLPSKFPWTFRRHQISLGLHFILPPSQKVAPSTVTNINSSPNFTSHPRKHHAEDLHQRGRVEALQPEPGHHGGQPQRQPEPETERGVETRIVAKRCSRIDTGERLWIIQNHPHGLQFGSPVLEKNPWEGSKLCVECGIQTLGLAMSCNLIQIGIRQTSESGDPKIRMTLFAKPKLRIGVLKWLKPINWTILNLSWRLNFISLLDFTIISHWFPNMSKQSLKHQGVS